MCTDSKRTKKSAIEIEDLSPESIGNFKRYNYEILNPEDELYGKKNLFDGGKNKNPIKKEKTY